MTKDVLVTIAGSQFDVGDEPIELMVPGTYYLKNGKHYVLYEELPDEDSPVIRNTVKFYEGHFEIIKKGGNNSMLMFDEGRQTTMVYETIMGPMEIAATTTSIMIQETEELLHAKVCYSLDINHNFVSECEVDFKVQAR